MSNLSRMMEKENVDIEIIRAIKAIVTDFLGLSDTPNDYTGHASKVVSVKGTEDGLEFIVVSAADDKVKVSVDDTTTNYLISKIIAQSTKITLTENNPAANETLGIDVDPSKINLADLGIKTFLNLTDVPSSYTGDGGEILFVKGAEDGLEFRPQDSMARSAQVGTVIDFSGDEIKFMTLVGNTTFTISNPILGKKIVLELQGIFTVTLPASVDIINGDYCPNIGLNYLFLWCNDSATPTYVGAWGVMV